MTGRTNAVNILGGGAELVTGTIHGPTGFSPTRTFVYSNGESAQYVDVVRNVTQTIHVAKNSIISSKVFSTTSPPMILGDAELEIRVGGDSETFLWVYGDFSINF